MNKPGASDISGVYPDGLCMGCGTCAGACPNAAISIGINRKDGLYMPGIDDSLCNQCGVCLQVCPGHSVDFPTLNSEVFGKQPDDRWIGNYEGIYIGHSADYEMRLSSSSGGLVTALLVFALEEGIIDYALVTRMKVDNPLESEVIMARTKDELLSSSGSKYCPSDVNAMLKDAANSGGKCAVVGLPCHMHGIRKFERINKKLKERIVLRLGLMCSNNATYLGTEYFLKKWGIRKEDVGKINFRDSGWVRNYNMVVILRDGSRRVLPRAGSPDASVFKSILHNSVYHYDFVIPRCLTCCDHTAELSDISFGDPRLPDLIRTEKAGKSLVVTRSSAGEEILKSAAAAGKIEITENIGIERFYQGQNLSFKKKAGFRMSALKMVGKAVPDYNTQKLSASGIAGYFNILSYIPSYHSSHRMIWPLLFPFAVIRYYVKKLFVLFRAIKRKVTGKQ
jgi:coenzyme F420 hydrogenase subunit beta